LGININDIYGVTVSNENIEKVYLYKLLKISLSIKEVKISKLGKKRFF